jgi:hypothetical protein
MRSYRRAGVVCGLGVAVLWAVAGGFPPARAQDATRQTPSSAPERAAPIPFSTLAARYDLRPLDDGPRWERLEVESLRWSNPVRNVDGGTVFLWCVRGRPQALVTLFTSAGGPPTIEHELSSLTDAPFAGTFDGKVVWKPKDAGVAWFPVPGAPPPAAGRPGRLAQMRQISSEFVASHVKDENDRPGALRRLTSPIHRYPESADRDGALFAFAQTTDPELVLLLETEPPTELPANGRASTEQTASGRKSGSSGYRFAIARTSSYSMTVRHKDRVVWSAETWSWATRNPSEHYTMTFSKEPGLFGEETQHEAK